MNNIKIMMLRYPSGLYMVDFFINLISLHSAWVNTNIFTASQVKFYLEGVENEFIERLAFQTNQQMKVYITDEFLLCLLSEGEKIFK